MQKGEIVISPKNGEFSQSEILAVPINESANISHISES
jgi:hypothetical protein